MMNAWYEGIGGVVVLRSPTVIVEWPTGVETPPVDVEPFENLKIPKLKQVFPSMMAKELISTIPSSNTKYIEENSNNITFEFLKNREINNNTNETISRLCQE